MRFSVIDGLRGYFLILMAFSHFGTTLGFNPHAMAYRNVGFSDVAMGFVVLSGVVIGFVYGGKALSHGLPEVRKAVLARARLVYLFHVGLVLFALLVTMMIGGSGEHYVLDSFGDYPLLTAINSILLAGGPTYMDILPLYVVYLLLTPFALKLLIDGRVALLLAISGTCWVFADMGFTESILNRIEDALDLQSYDVRLGIAFDRLSWQVLYFGGLCAGFFVRKWKVVPRLTADTHMGLVWASAAVVLLLGLADYFDLLGVGRAQLRPLILLNLVAAAILIIFALSVTKYASDPSTPWVFRLFRKFAESRPLVFLGQHSLQVFAYHIFFIYTAAYWVSTFEPSGPTRAAVLSLAICSLYLPAKANHSYRARITGQRRNEQVPSQAEQAN